MGEHGEGEGVAADVSEVGGEWGDEAAFHICAVWEEGSPRADLASLQEVAFTPLYIYPIFSVSCTPLTPKLTPPSPY